MPYYNFRCQNCNLEFEQKQSMFDLPPLCPECENGTVKIFKSVPTTHFRGTGFAANDLKDNLKRDKNGRLVDAVPDAS